MNPLEVGDLVKIGEVNKTVWEVIGSADLPCPKTKAPRQFVQLRSVLDHNRGASAWFDLCKVVDRKSGKRR